MPRGRPKGSKNKSKNNIVLNNIFEEELKKEESEITPVIAPPTPTTDELKENKKIKIKLLGICDLCGKELYITPHHLNLNYITGKANWWRGCNKDRLVVCGDCASEFSEIIDKFILNKNPNLNKFGIDTKS